MTPLSVVIITFNEEKNIARCLESVLPVADEIVVVDSFSTDDTERICKNFPVSFYQHAFQGFSEQKNLANNYASHSYVLSIDADEVISDTLRDSILEEKKNFKFDRYSFNRLTNYCGRWIKHSGWYPDRKTRLWRKESAYWNGDIHEKLIFNNDSPEKILKGDLLHYTYYTIQEHIAQSNKFSTIGAKQAFEKGRKSNLLKAIFFPFWRFFRNYFFRFGFLDGYYGLIVCSITGFENFLKYIKMIELQKNSRKGKRD